jgi:S1-C subfamily serine protease
MLREMRFCRNCGYRLGEGVEDYTETRRFDAPPSVVTAPLPSAAQTTPHQWGAIQQPQAAPPVAAWQPRQAKKGMHWMVWVVIGLVASSAFGGMFFSRSGTGARSSVNQKADAPRAFIGAENLDTAEHIDGVFIGEVTPPGSAADKAGLVGGDIITSFDGQTLKTKEQLIKILVNTLPGKTVDVVFLRDGQTVTTKLSTVSEEQNDSLEMAFGSMEHGFLGVDDLDRVGVPGANIYGVRVGNVIDNRPAFIAGMKDGDIIIEYNGAPIRTVGELEMRIDRTPPLSLARIVVLRGPENGPLEKLVFEFKVGKD